MLELTAQTVIRKQSSGGRRYSARFAVEMEMSLKQRLEALAVETQVPVNEMVRYALRKAVREGELNPAKFVQKVALVKLQFLADERIKTIRRENS